MNISLNKELLQTVLLHKKTVGFIITLLGIFFTDLFIASSFPFWFFPVFFGLILGLYLGYPMAGSILANAAILGRFISIMVFSIINSGSFTTTDLFIQAIGDVIGVSLPLGGLLITLLSMLICGLFTFLAGSISGSVAKIVSFSLENRVPSLKDKKHRLKE